MENKYENIYLLTDGCMWEANKRGGTTHPHSIEVVDMETGAVRYITSGSRIAFVEGTISDLRTQEAYNKATSQAVPCNGEGVQEGKSGKGNGRTKIKRLPKTQGV